MILVETLGLVTRSYGWSIRSDQILYIMYIAFVNLTTSSVIFYIITAIRNFERISIKMVNEMQTEVKVIKEVQKEYM
jgi:NADH:ubiquinone oxidoreductase subunit K